MKERTALKSMSTLRHLSRRFPFIFAQDFQILYFSLVRLMGNTTVWKPFLVRVLIKVMDGRRPRCLRFFLEIFSRQKRNLDNDLTLITNGFLREWHDILDTAVHFHRAKSVNFYRRTASVEWKWCKVYCHTHSPRSTQIGHPGTAVAPYQRHVREIIRTQQKPVNNNEIKGSDLEWGKCWRKAGGVPRPELEQQSRPICGV